MVKRRLPPGRGSLEARNTDLQLVVISEAEEETGVSISETGGGGVEMVEGADELALLDMGMIKEKDAKIH